MCRRQTPIPGEQSGARQHRLRENDLAFPSHALGRSQGLTGSLHRGADAARAEVELRASRKIEAFEELPSETRGGGTQIGKREVAEPACRRRAHRLEVDLGG